MTEKDAIPMATTRARWIEIAVSVGLSIVTSAVVVAWTVSATLATFETKLESQVQEISYIKSQQQIAQSERSAQNSQIQVQASQWTEVVRRLDSIDRKLERR